MMKAVSIRPWLPLGTLIFQVAAADSAVRLSLGDGRIDGTGIEPYRFIWQQCSRQEDAWVSGPPLTEELVVIGDALLRQRQIVSRPDGVETRATTYFDRSSFAPLRMELHVTKDGETLADSEYTLDEDGYTGVATRGGATQPVSGMISSVMLHGGAMGLPLATLPAQPAPLEFAASMISFDGTYTVIATWVGEEALEFDGQEIAASLIDVEWHHRESGDVYPAGPDASGGRYWVVQDPPQGFPYVPRYQTDTYAVEFVRSACPDEK